MYSPALKPDTISILPQLLSHTNCCPYPVDGPEISTFALDGILVIVTFPDSPVTVTLLQSPPPFPPPFGVSSQTFPMPSPSLSA